MRKNDEARLEIYEVEAMSDTVRKDFVYGFIAGLFIGTAGGFVINQVKKRKQLEQQNQPAEAKKPSVKEKVSAQTDALKANAQSQIQDIKDKAQQLKSDVKQKFNNDEQETDPKALRAQRAAIRNEAAAHDLSNVSPQAQEVQNDNNPLKSSQPDTVPFHEFTATGNALAAKEKAKLIENDNTVAAKVAELFKAEPVKSSGFKTVPVLVTVAAATATAAGTKKSADAKASKPADAEKRTAQTHEKASFNKGVITHDKATANHSEAHKTPEASGKVESKTVNDTKTTKTETTKTTNTPKKTASTTKTTAKATSPKDATKTTKTTTQKPAAKGNKTTTQKTTTKTTKSAANKSTKKPSVTPANKKTTNNTTKSQPKGETTTKKIDKKTFND
ncbi:hypothetical protein [Staphylococcus simulans]|uniref:hypothetical protein n=1 Tax=Staphylococcus simulans TaxID=1286 RepID=UPI000D1DFE32|nr:hypothetical protein [Staphylococcus simulans]MDY5061342.1 hypothetical protein [Staphylococcus simulans]PTJ18012.1 hypothetical protein BU038_05205 [Staphylococcus simulans]